MKKYFSLLAIMVVLLSSCGGKTPNPVMISQYGDEQKSCEALKYEMVSIQGQMQAILPKTEKTGKNVALGVAGAFFLIPWLFMDFSSAEQNEYEAYRNRYNHLAAIAITKQCGIEKKNYPSVEELKKMHDEYKKKEEFKKMYNEYKKKEIKEQEEFKRMYDEYKKKEENK